MSYKPITTSPYTPESAKLHAGFDPYDPKPLGQQAPGVLTAKELKERYQAIDQWVIEGKNTHNIHDQISSYPIRKPSTLGQPINFTDPSDFSKKVQFLKSAHQMLTDFRGADVEQSIWQVRQRSTNPSPQLQQLAQYQHLMARDCLNKGGIDFDASLARVIKRKYQTKKTDLELKRILLTASVNGLIKPSAKDIFEGNRLKLEALFTTLLKRTAQYEKTYNIKPSKGKTLSSLYQSAATHSKKMVRQKPHQWFFNFFRSTKYRDHVDGSESTAKLIGNTSTTVYYSNVPPPAPQTNAPLESVAIGSGFINAIEASFGFVATRKKISYWREQKSRNKFCQQYYTENAALLKRSESSHYNLAKTYANIKVNYARGVIDRSKSLSTHIDIYGNTLAYSGSMMRTGLKSAGFFSKALGNFTATPGVNVALNAAAYSSAPVSLIAAGVTAEQMTKAYSATKHDKRHKRHLKRSLESTSNNAPDNYKQEKIVRQLLNNYQFHTSKPLRFKTIKTAANLTQDTTTAVVGSMLTISAFGVAAAAPPLAAFAAAGAVGSVAGLVGLSVYKKITHIENTSTHHVNAFRELTATLNEEKPNYELVAKQLKKHHHFIKGAIRANDIGKYEFERYKERGALKRSGGFKATPNNIELIKLMLEQESTRDYLSTFDASDNLFELFKLIKNNTHTGPISELLHRIGIPDQVVEDIRQSDETYDSVKASIDILATSLKVTAHTQATQYHDYLFQHSKPDDDTLVSTGSILDEFREGRSVNSHYSQSDNSTILSSVSQPKPAVIEFNPKKSFGFSATKVQKNIKANAPNEKNQSYRRNK